MAMPRQVTESSTMSYAYASMAAWPAHTHRVRPVRLMIHAPEYRSQSLTLLTTKASSAARSSSATREMLRRTAMPTC